MLKMLDYTLFLLVLGVGVPAFFFTKYQLLAALLILVGFGVVTQVGGWCHHRIRSLEVQITKLDREEKNRRR